MYEHYFEMENTPFVRNIPTDRLYTSPAIEEAMGRLKYTVDHQRFSVVLADPGVGKSTLTRMFVSSLPKDKYLPLYLSDSKLTPRWLYAGLLDQMGVEAKINRGDSKRILQREIENVRTAQGRKAVCILDEAHLLDKETLEEFRFLLLFLINDKRIYTQSKVILNHARNPEKYLILSGMIEDNFFNSICYISFD